MTPAAVRSPPNTHTDAKNEAHLLIADTICVSASWLESVLERRKSLAAGGAEAGDKAAPIWAAASVGSGADTRQLGHAGGWWG